MTGNYKYKNYYTSRRVHVDSVDENEYTITCLVRENEGNIKEYFVSRQYDVNIVPNGLPVFGRFIFHHGPDNKLTLSAMAEEPAILLPTFGNSRFAEVLYALGRNGGELQISKCYI